MENETNGVIIDNSEKGFKALLIAVVVLIIVAVLMGFFIVISDSLENEKTYTNVIKIDASLATQPLTDAYIENLNNFNIEADYSNTDPAYTKLINKEVDLIVVTEPSIEELQRATDAGVKLVVTPVVNEGFTFYTNISNPVDNLTIEQIQKIYTGQITNWKELGGNDEEIIAYQRPTNSGSQTGILSLVMKGLKMKEPTTSEYVETMAGIIDVVANYESGKNAIGYSYYYYATTMYGNNSLKFFKVNGVEPNHDSIQDESYPLITAYYIVTLEDNDKEEVKALKETLLASKGQKIARGAGYVELK